MARAATRTRARTTTSGTTPTPCSTCAPPLAPPLHVRRARRRPRAPPPLRSGGRAAERGGDAGAVAARQRRPGCLAGRVRRVVRGTHLSGGANGSSVLRAALLRKSGLRLSCTASGPQLHGSRGSTGLHPMPPHYSRDPAHGPGVGSGLWPRLPPPTCSRPVSGVGLGPFLFCGLLAAVSRPLLAYCFSLCDLRPFVITRMLFHKAPYFKASYSDELIPNPLSPQSQSSSSSSSETLSSDSAAVNSRNTSA
jgi:hypothetical protein